MTTAYEIRELLKEMPLLSPNAEMRARVERDDAALLLAVEALERYASSEVRPTATEVKAQATLTRILSTLQK